MVVPQKRVSIFAAILAAVFAISLLISAQDVASGVKDGFFLCVNSMIPSLFCFLILTSFVLISGLNRILSAPLVLLTRFLFRLDKDLGSVILMSFVGGYPIGANSVARLRREKAISVDTAQRMMGFCCCAGPSFVITVVGGTMFGNLKTGIVLYAIQVLAAILLGIFSSLGVRVEELPKHSKVFPSYGEALVEAVNQSVVSMAQMCGYVLFFSAVLALLQNICSGSVLALLSGLLEVTNGCRAATTLNGIWSLVVVSFFLSFAGISVFCQLSGILNGSGVSMRKILLCRMIHGFLCATMALCYARLHPAAVPAFQQNSRIMPLVTQNTPILTLCLLMMCSILLISVKCEKSSIYDSISS